VRRWKRPPIPFAEKHLTGGESTDGGGIGEGAADGSRAVLSSSDHSSTTSTASAVADWKAEATSSSAAEWNTEPRL
jgi:hypothetical protein